MKTGILIPAYNEANRIRELVKTIKSFGFTPIVIDDGSVDGTAEEAGASGAKVIRHKQNMGKGATLKTGFEYMLKEGYDNILIMDGDGQHSPGDIRKFINLGAERQDTMIIGNRMSDTRNMPLDRKLTNIFMSFVISLICGQKIPDSQCGFRLINKNLLNGLKIDSSRFEVESEILIKAGRAGVKILSVPIETLYGREASQINPFRDTCRFLIFLLKLPFMK